MNVIVKIDDSVSQQEIQSWIDEVLLKMPPVIDAHIACGSCTCGDGKKYIEVDPVMETFLKGR